jgi:hypothetical protein
MAKYKADHLIEMIRGVVREEVKLQVKGLVAETISEVLSERYLRKLIETNAGARPRGVSMSFPIQGDDEPDEDVPEALDNNIQAPGQPNPRFQKTPKNRSVQQFHEETKRNEMLSLFFEGTQPLDKQEARVAEGVPLEQIAEATDGEGPAKWAELFKDAERLAETKRPIQKDPAAEEARLARLRAQLDVKVG